MSFATSDIHGIYLFKYRSYSKKAQVVRSKLNIFVFCFRVKYSMESSSIRWIQVVSAFYCGGITIGLIYPGTRPVFSMCFL